MAGTLFFDITGEAGTLLVFDKGSCIEQRPFVFRDGKPELTGKVDTEADAVVSLPLHLLHFRVVDLPFSDPEKAREVLPFELEGIILEKTGGIVLDAVPLWREGEKHKFLAAYLEKQTMRSLLDGFAQYGVDPGFVTSIELREALAVAANSEDRLASQLISTTVLSEGKRISLASAELNDGTFNLRRGDFQFTRSSERTRRSLRTAAVMVIAVVILISADLGLRAATMFREADMLERSVSTGYASLFPEEKAGDYSGLMYRMRSRVKTLKSRQDALSGVSPLDTLLKMSDVKSAEAKITEASFGTDANIIKGETETLSGVEAIREELESLDHDVKITDTHNTAGGTTAFTITFRRDTGR